MVEESQDQTRSWPPPPPGSTTSRLARGHPMGRYVVLEHVGDGGMGSVYSAYDPQLDRRVALKLLRAERFADRDLGEARLRLQREAQALARLNHPHVVAVYDAGVLVDGQVFVAMEYVEGQDLGRWLQDANHDRSWRPVVELFMQAGEGLAAAHRAGLLHRDFKPANVIVGRGGRVRVADFGLARPAGGEPDQAAAGSGSAVIDSPVTRPGQFPGTPAYMSPEQLRGLPADGRSDQFAFCVALYQALFGQLPFSGENRWQLLRAIETGRPRPRPRNSDVPTWLERTLLRGLAADPEQRHESMEVLLARLHRRPRRRRIAAGLLVTAAAAVMAFEAWRPEPCGGGAARLEGTWDAERRGALLDAFERADRPYAGELGRRIAAALDRYTADWVDMYGESCRATRRGEQSAQLLDLRTACLERRLTETRAVSDLLVAADDSMVDRASSAVGDLGNLAACADARTLRAVAPLPEDPAARRRVDDLLRLAAETRASYQLSSRDASRARSDRLAALAASTEHAPALAESFHARGLVASFLDQQAEARAAHLEAVAWADAGSHDEIRVSSLMSLVWLSERQAAERWLRLAHGAVERIDNPVLRASWLQTAARLRLRAGDYAGAIEAAERAVELSRRNQGDDHRATGRILATLGSAQYRLARYDEALEIFTEAAEIRRANLGPGHPEVAYVEHALGEMLSRLGRYSEAEQVLQRALETLLAVHGERHSRVFTVLSSLGNLHLRLGELDRAEAELERCLRLRREMPAEQEPELAADLNSLGAVLSRRGDPGAAEARYAEALEIHRRSRGEEHPETLISRINLGRSQLDQDRAAEAVRHFEAAHRSALAALGPAHPTSVNAGLALGEARIELGEVETGARGIAEAASRVDPEKAEAWLVAATLFAEARAAAALGHRETMAEKIRQARRFQAEHGDPSPYFMERLERSERRWRQDLESPEGG